MMRTILAGLLLGGACLSAAAGTLYATAQLHADQPGAKISRYIYGQFSEHLGRGIYDGIWVGERSSIPNVRGIRSDVVEALRDIHVPLIRWPGGCFADEYRWRDGVGPRASRPVRKNNWWAGSAETNQFGTHEFMDFAEQIGADPYVSINMGSSGPTEMREWMEYMTSDGNDTLANERRKNGRDKPFKVPVVGIGNESWGCGGEMRPEYYANEYRRFHSFFHNRGQIAPSAIRVASGANEFDVNWTDVVMAQAGDKMDAISLHYYTFPRGKGRGNRGAATGFTKEDWVKTFHNTLRMDEVVSLHSAVMDRHDPQRRVGLYVDEWGTWYDVEKGTEPGHLYQQNTLRDGVVAAANFNIFHRHADRVRMTAIAQTINVLQSMILTEGGRIVRTPTYYAYRMYVPFQDATYLPMDVATPTYRLDELAIPSINASAARGKDGKVYIGIANMNPDDEVALTVSLAGVQAGKVGGEILTADKLDRYNEFGKPPAVAPVAFHGARLADGALKLNIPARSVVVVALD